MRGMNLCDRNRWNATALLVLLNVGVSMPARSGELLKDSASDSKLYCGTFHWAGKFATDAIWIEDGKFNVSLDNETTKNYLQYYSPKNGLQGHGDGDCVCIKGAIKKTPVNQTSGDLGWLVKRLDGIYGCSDHKKVL